MSLKMDFKIEYRFSSLRDSGRPLTYIVPLSSIIKVLEMATDIPDHRGLVRKCVTWVTYFRVLLCSSSNTSTAVAICLMSWCKADTSYRLL